MRVERMVVRLSDNKPEKFLENYSVNVYRTKHRRCRTCKYASQHTSGWSCKAKMKSHIGNVSETMIAGIMCKLYEPYREREVW